MNLLILALIACVNTARDKSFGCSCGQITKKKNEKGFRVMGGVSPKQVYPWLVAIKVKYTKKGTNVQKKITCTATLLNRQWAITTGGCFCTSKIGYNCQLKEGKDYITPQITKEEMRSNIEVYLVQKQMPSNKQAISPDYIRQVRQIIVHKDFGIQPDAKVVLNNIALVEFTKPISVDAFKYLHVHPICLPGTKDKDEGTTGYIAGYGLLYDKQCMTGPIGPEIWHPCATTTVVSPPGEESQTINMSTKSCITNVPSPAMAKNEPCFFFHKWLENTGRKIFSKGNTEVVLVAEGKGKENATSCIASDVNNKAGTDGWCGIKQPGSSDEVSRPTVGKGWGYCTDACRKGVRWPEQYQSAKLNILKNSECDIFLRLINSSTLTQPDKMICAGDKIPIKSVTDTFTYIGEGINMTFKERDSFPDWTPAIVEMAPGLNYMIGGSGACGGDGGSPLHTKKYHKKKGKKKKLIRILMGLVSGGSSCGQINTPGLYVRIKHYVEWIKKYASTSGKCSK